MVFSAPIFLFVFLPATVVLAFLVPARRRNLVLLAASVVFYLWGAGAIIGLLLVSIAGNDFAMRRIAVADDAGRRRWVAIAIAGNVALLGYFKYIGFAFSNVAAAFGRPGLELPAWADVLLPIGISFFTFQAMSAVVDLARGEAPLLPRRRDFALFVAFFPQLIAGPIVRYGDFAPQLLQRETSTERAFQGTARFVVGLAKKVLIADNVAILADAVFGAQGLTTVDAWVGALAYTVQIYFDFSGYSDMAIGLGAIFGFHLPENFARPYGSRTMTEFWRRWHITLSSWFRDYLYIPMGGSQAGSWTTYRNLGVVFLATGLWHGAAWTFVIWGLFHGLVLVVERLLDARTSSSVGRWAVTFVLVVFGWVLFRSETLGGALDHAATMVTWQGSLTPGLAYELGGRPGLALAIGMASVLVPRDFVLGERLSTGVSWQADWGRFAVVALVFPVVLVAAFGADFSPFLYFQF